MSDSTSATEDEMKKIAMAALKTLGPAAAGTAIFALGIGALIGMALTLADGNREAMRRLNEPRTVHRITVSFDWTDGLRIKHETYQLPPPAFRGVIIKLINLEH
jgi:hypothetical protein